MVPSLHEVLDQHEHAAAGLPASVLLLLPDTEVCHAVSWHLFCQTTTAMPTVL